MKFRVGGDNRSGSVSVKSGTKGEPRDDNYNIDPSRRYRKLSRVLSEKAGSGNAIVSATLETSSDFNGYADHECDGLSLHSKARSPRRRTRRQWRLESFRNRYG